MKPIQDYKYETVVDYIEESLKHTKNIILDGEILKVETKTGKILPFGSLARKSKSKKKKRNFDDDEAEEDENDEEDIENGKKTKKNIKNMSRKDQELEIQENVAIFLFDVLYFEGKSLIDVPIKQRRVILEKNVQAIKNRIMISNCVYVEGTKEVSFDFNFLAIFHNFLLNFSKKKTGNGGKTRGKNE